MYPKLTKRTPARQGWLPYCVLLLLLVLGGCKPTTTGTEPTTPPSDSGPTVDQPPAPDERVTPPTHTTLLPSTKAKVRFKGGERIIADLARAFKMDTPEERKALCRELGQDTLTCTSKNAHGVVLGGVAPYRQSVRKPWEDPPVIAPIAMDRVALSACQTRTQKDFDKPDEARFFGALAKATGEGDEASRKDAVTKLYRAILLRDPTDKEQAAFVGFWDKVKAGNAKKPKQDWSVLVCYGIVTSIEFLFY